jgi:hypothetical protein
MTARILRIIFAAALAISWAGGASAQITPGDTGAGERRGIESLNQSGEVGTVTLFHRGPSSTLVVLDVQQAPDHPQIAALQRAKDCSRIQPQIAFKLNNVVHGHSATVVAASEDRLLSGNYAAIVRSSVTTPAFYVNCGHLYR